MPWNFRRYGSPSQPIHKSHLNNLTGEYGCAQKFKREQDARADKLPGSDERETVGGKAAAGTAAHETIARALSKPDVRAHLLAGGTIATDSVERVFREEWQRETGGRTPQWYGDDAEDGGVAAIMDRVTMVRGILNSLSAYVHSIELLEAGFVAPVGDYWISGHIDIVYRPRSNPARIAIADWKTGLVKPLPIELDHGWEAGVYSAAVRHGVFVPREQIVIEQRDGLTYASLGENTVKHSSRYIAEREVLESTMVELAIKWQATDDKANLLAIGLCMPDDIELKTFGEFPAEIYTVHAADYVPYKKAGYKAVKRVEDLKHYGYERPVARHKYEAGQARGPAWLPVQLSEYDLPRLETRLRSVVGMIRMGFFVDNVGPNCLRCSYASDCLTHGYGPRGDERKELERALRAVGTDTNDGLDTLGDD